MSKETTPGAIVHYNRGCALAMKGEWDGAISEFRTALLIDPNHAHAHVNLGNALSLSGDMEGAISAYRAALRLAPDDAYAHIGLGATLAKQGNRDEAAAEFRTALRLAPNDVETHNNLGLVLAEQGDWEGAITEFRTVMSLDPDHAVARTNLGKALSKLPKEKGADGNVQDQSALSEKDRAIIQRLGEPEASADPVEKQKDLMRLFGPAHYVVYAHSLCATALYQRILSKGHVIDPEQTEEFAPNEILGHEDIVLDQGVPRRRGITHCDHCGVQFQAGDGKYVSYCVLEPDELRLWQEVKNEDKGKSEQP